MSLPWWFDEDDLSRMGDYVLRGCDRSGLTAPVVRVSERKLRLFACAVARQSWHLLDEDNRQAIVAAEKYVDGIFSIRDLEIACARAETGPARTDKRLYRGWLVSVPGTIGVFERAIHLWSDASDTLRAHLLRDVVGDPCLPIWEPTKDLEWAPPRPYLLFNPDWRTSQVEELAFSAYIGRCPETGMDTELLGVLWDALEDAGCQSQEIRDHLLGSVRCWRCSPSRSDRLVGITTRWINQADPCPACRGSGLVRPQHHRGCWVVDYLTRRI